MEINPYQSPHVEDPRPVRRNLRRRVGVGVILLLTPLAVGVALFGSCAVAVTLPQLSMWWLTVVVPLFVLTALMTYAAAIDERRSQGEPRSRERYLMATPRVVAAAALVGIGLAVLIVGVASEVAGGISEPGVSVATIVFFAVPSLTLLVMLYLAWRAVE